MLLDYLFYTIGISRQFAKYEEERGPEGMKGQGLTLAEYRGQVNFAPQDGYSQRDKALFPKLEIWQKMNT